LPPAKPISEFANAALPHRPAIDHDGRAFLDAALLVRDELHGLPSGRRLRADEHGREAVQRDTLGAIDDGRREILVAQRGDPLRELTTQRCQVFLLVRPTCNPE
jgi:hypothetical protein